MTDSNGETVWRGASTAWGHSLRESTPVLWDTPQNLRFQGQYLDRDTGLHYNTFRYYDPAGGCYTQMDPIGLRGGLNLYQYGPNPLSYIDPLGLITEDIKLNPGEILVNPKDINFSQTTINGAFDTPEGKRSVQSVINDVRRGDVKVTDFPAIKVVNVKGQLVARDGNSRLAIAIKAKAKQIKVIIENNVDQLRDFTSRSRKNGLPNTGTSETPKCK
ncbi:RHS repeat-associated core domain-containing protein [Kosakonia sp. SMBL-WEM22]|uniref:RHS repeat-associated core domain-containing protein n=1 Tax=Kosakonia sp. SMBL-WEM22 TaxID=2725560 RepID=UPI0031F8CE38